MGEWTIEVDSGAGATDDVDQVAQLQVELEAGGALGPACSHDATTGAVGAAYQVEAESFFDAMHIGQSVWLAAMRGAGIPASISAYEQRPNNPAGA